MSLDTEWLLYNKYIKEQLSNRFLSLCCLPTKVVPSQKYGLCVEILRIFRS